MTTTSTWTKRTTAAQPRQLAAQSSRLRAWRNRRLRLPLTLVVGLALVLVIVAVAILAPQLAPFDVAAIAPAERLQAPNNTHLLGTDSFGRDVFSRLLYGARYSIMVAALAVSVAAVPGILLGVIAGMRPGWVEATLTRLMDAWMAVPSLLLAIVMASTLGRTVAVLALALGLAGISTYYRQARAETLRVNAALYIEAARSLGGRERHIMLRHVLPNIMPSLLVLVSLRIGGMLLAVSALGFIGLGVAPPDPEWGALMAEGRDYIRQAWWLTFFPGCAIALSTFSLNLLGDGLRDLFDPRRSN